MTKELLTKPSKLSEPALHPWDEVRRLFAWHGEGGNSRRSWLEYRGLNASDFSARNFMLPAAHVYTSEGHGGDAILLGVRGAIEVAADGMHFPLNALDMVVIPAGTPYECIDVGGSNSMWCGIFADEAPRPLPVSRPSLAQMTWASSLERFQWTLPFGDRLGFRRASGPYLDTGQLRGHTARQPPGQSTPWHEIPRDILFMPLVNEVEFCAAGKTWPLQPLDGLLVPAHTPYIYTNYGFEEVVFLSMGGKVPPGGKSIYYGADPGWPVRQDAEVLDTRIDVHGNARVVVSNTPP